MSDGPQLHTPTQPPYSLKLHELGDKHYSSLAVLSFVRQPTPYCNC